MADLEIADLHQKRLEWTWKGFRTPGWLPRAAVREALEHWEALAPAFAERLRVFADNPWEGSLDVEGVLPTLHLFAQQRDARAYRPLLALICRPGKEVDDLLGEGIIEILGKIVSSVFDGDPVPIQEAILDPGVDPFVAMTLFDSLAFLTEVERIPLGETRLFVERCHAQLPRDGSAGERWVGWQRVISYLGLTEYVPQVREAFKLGLISDIWMNYRDFESDLNTSLDARSRGELPPDKRMGYFEDALEEFANWPFYSARYRRTMELREMRERYERLQQGDAEAAIWRDVGRNDPCPCGSGKKYKKCCLGKTQRPAVGPA